MKLQYYRGEWLHKNSHAYQLWLECTKTGKFAALDRHLKQVNSEALALLTRYGNQTT